jgi:hypothetical protein
LLDTILSRFICYDRVSVSEERQLSNVSGGRYQPIIKWVCELILIRHGNLDHTKILSTNETSMHESHYGLYSVQEHLGLHPPQAMLIIFKGIEIDVSQRWQLR